MSFKFCTACQLKSWQNSVLLYFVCFYEVHHNSAMFSWSAQVVTISHHQSSSSQCEPSTDCMWRSVMYIQDSRWSQLFSLYKYIYTIYTVYKINNRTHVCVVVMSWSRCDQTVHGQMYVTVHTWYTHELKHHLIQNPILKNNNKPLCQPIGHLWDYLGCQVRARDPPG